MWHIVARSSFQQRIHAISQLTTATVTPSVQLPRIVRDAQRMFSATGDEDAQAAAKGCIDQRGGMKMMHGGSHGGTGLLFDQIIGIRFGCFHTQLTL